MKLIRILAYIRLALVPLAVAKVALDRDGFPTSRYELAAWLVVAAQALIALLLLVLAYRWRGRHRYLAGLNLLADAAVATALMFVFAWEPGQPLRSLLFLVVLEAALFFAWPVGCWWVSSHCLSSWGSSSGERPSSMRRCGMTR